MNLDKYECDGQMSIFDLEESEQPIRTLNDYWHAEALEKPIRLTSKELKVEQEKSTEVTKKSCSNCLRFNMDIEQPPDGWGHIGYCVEHHEKCNDISYCQSWEPKPVEVIQYTAKEYAQAIVKHLIDHCRSWGMNEKLNQLKEDKTTEIFHKLFCKITRTYYVIMDECHFNVEFCKDNTVTIKRIGRDYNNRPLDATIQLQDVLNEL